MNAWLEILAQMRATYTNVISSIRKKKLEERRKQRLCKYNKNKGTVEYSTNIHLRRYPCNASTSRLFFLPSTFACNASKAPL